jgi:hypothetical protein
MLQSLLTPYWCALYLVGANAYGKSAERIADALAKRRCTAPKALSSRAFPVRRNGKQGVLWSWE